MPTFDVEPRFPRDYAKLTEDEKLQFAVAYKRMVTDLRAGQGFRKGLRVKGVQGHPGVFEMTWAGDGRATFEYGVSPHPGDTHIIWRRIGTHAILQEP